MKQSYIKEMAIALLAAFAVGWVTHGLLGVVAFFAIGAFLSKGSVSDEEMQRIMNTPLYDSPYDNPSDYSYYGNRN